MRKKDWCAWTGKVKKRNEWQKAIRFVLGGDIMVYTSPRNLYLPGLNYVDVEVLLDTYVVELYESNYSFKSIKLNKTGVTKIYILNSDHFTCFELV